MASADEATTSPSGQEAPHGADAPQLRARNRRRALLAAGALAALALVVATALLAGPNVREPARNRGGPAAGFELGNVRRGEPPVSLADYRGRPIVVNFFASWCVPCRREMPGFQAVHERLGRRVAFVGVDHQDRRDGALDLLEETGVSYPAGFDPGGSVAAAYGVYGMPTTLFISPDGRVLERHTGEMSDRQLEATIRRLFATS